jgi:uncharacterized OB-fold protein
MRLPAHPGLYRVDAEYPVLNGTRCAQCGQVAFPPITIGCDVCGAAEDLLEPTSLPARGVLHSIAIVHLHQGEPAAPFAVAEVLLDSGPLIRAMAADIGNAAIGTAMSAVWVVTKIDENGDETVEPTFVGATT